MSGAYFHGWGYLRFNEQKRVNGASARDEASDACGDGEDELFPARVSLPHSVTQRVTLLGASPFEIREARRRPS